MHVMRVPVLPPDLIAPLVGYLVIANLAALAMFAFRRAGSHDGQWGDYETRTLFLAVMGGWPGAMLGRLLFRPKREIRGFGLLLDLSVFALPVVVTVPFLLRAVPGWMPRSEVDQPTQIAETTSGTVAGTMDVGQAATPVGAALLASEAPAGTLAGNPVSTQVASTVPPPRPAGLVSTGSTAPAAAPSTTVTASSSSTGSTATASTTTTTSTASTTTAMAQSPTAATSTPTVRHRLLRMRRLRKK